MVDLSGMFRRAKGTGRRLAQEAPDQARRVAADAPERARKAAQEAPERARRAAGEARRTADATRAVLDDRTDGKVTDALEAGGRAVRSAKGKGRDVARGAKDFGGDIRDAYREEANDDSYEPRRYRPDPIDAPEPIDRPEPI